MLAGDFNMIYCSEDKNNDNVNRAMLGRFRRFVNDLELKEIPLLGRRYTWSNGRESPTLVKLDRVLCTNDWEDIYPESLLQSTATEMSDHCPLILGLAEGTVGKKGSTSRVSGHVSPASWKPYNSLGMNRYLSAAPLSASPSS